MFPPGFYGTRSDLFMDVVITIVVASPLLMLGSYYLARKARYPQHRAAQVGLGSVFAVVLLAFEAYVRIKGGVNGLSEGGPWHQTTTLYGVLAVHLCFAVSSTVLWAWLLLTSLRRFKKTYSAGDFNATHRRWGRIAMIDMVLTAFTGLGVYLLCFAG